MRIKRVVISRKFSDFPGMISCSTRQFTNLSREIALVDIFEIEDQETKLIFSGESINSLRILNPSGRPERSRFGFLSKNLSNNCLQISSVSSVEDIARSRGRIEIGLISPCRERTFKHFNPLARELGFIFFWRKRTIDLTC